MVKNQLPEGVGKKIVEALKRQAEADVTPVDSVGNSFNIGLSQNSDNQTSIDSDFGSFQDVNNQMSINQQIQNENLIIEDDNDLSDSTNVQNIKEENQPPVQTEEVAVPAKFEVPKAKEENYSPSLNDMVSKPVEVSEPVFKETLNEEKPVFKTDKETSQVTFSQPHIGPVISQYSGMPLSEESVKQPVGSTVTISIPTNVAVLRNLIASLPVGVTKQTGAQIIRQTLEAMGLPMANVLKEAQEVQEELNTKTRECMLRIQEFKTNIMQLEQSVQEYQKNMTQINDLVSLFLLTDRK